MKRICTVVLGLLMLGVTYSFAQRLDKTEKKDWTKVPSITERPAPSDELYPGQNALRREYIQRKQEKEEAKQHWAKMTEEERRKEYALLERNLSGNKKEMERYKWTLGSDWSPVLLINVSINDTNQPLPGGVGSKTIFSTKYSISREEAVENGLNTTSALQSYVNSRNLYVVVLDRRLPNSADLEVEVCDADGKRLFKKSGKLLIRGTVSNSPYQPVNGYVQH